MPITFEEVTAEVQRDSPSSGSSGAPAPQAAASGADVTEQIAQHLSLMAQRHARICAD